MGGSPIRGTDRLPIEPLIDALTVECHIHIDGVCACNGNNRPGLAELARRLGFGDSSTIHRYRRGGGIPVYVADDWCARLELHPVTVWGDTYTALGLVDAFLERDRARLRNWVETWVFRHTPLIPIGGA